MKKLLLISIFLSAFSLYSQTISQKGEVNICFEGGVQFTGINDIYMPVSNNGIGYTFGPGIEYCINDIFKIHGAIIMDKRAFSLEGTFKPLILNDSVYTKSSYQHIVQNFTVNYLTIPISLIYIKGVSKFRMFLKGTFYYSIYMGSNQTGSNEVCISSTDANLFINSDYPQFSTPGYHEIDPEIQEFNSCDMGFNIFIGVEYNISQKVAITLSPCFSYSFENVWANPYRDVTWSTLYQINTGILYKIK